MFERPLCYKPFSCSPRLVLCGRKRAYSESSTVPPNYESSPLNPIYSNHRYGGHLTFAMLLVVINLSLTLHSGVEKFRDGTSSTVPIQGFSLITIWVLLGSIAIIRSFIGDDKHRLAWSWLLQRMRIKFPRGHVGSDCADVVVAKQISNGMAPHAKVNSDHLPHLFMHQYKYACPLCFIKLDEAEKLVLNKRNGTWLMQPKLGDLPCSVKSRANDSHWVCYHYLLCSEIYVSAIFGISMITLSQCSHYNYNNFNSSYGIIMFWVFDIYSCVSPFALNELFHYHQLAPSIIYLNEKPNW